MKLWKAITLLGALTVAGWAMPSTSRAHDGSWDSVRSEYRRDGTRIDHDYRDGGHVDHEYRPDGTHIDHDYTYGQHVDRYRRPYTNDTYRNTYDTDRPYTGWWGRSWDYRPAYRDYYRPSYRRDYCPPRTYDRSGYWGPGVSVRVR